MANAAQYANLARHCASAHACALARGHSDEKSVSIYFDSVKTFSQCAFVRVDHRSPMSDVSAAPSAPVSQRSGSIPNTSPLTTLLRVDWSMQCPGACRAACADECPLRTDAEAELRLCEAGPIAAALSPPSKPTQIGHLRAAGSAQAARVAHTGSASQSTPQGLRDRACAPCLAGASTPPSHRRDRGVGRSLRRRLCGPAQTHSLRGYGGGGACGHRPASDRPR